MTVRFFFLYWNRHNTLTYFDGFRKMCRGGSAAAADNPSAFHYNIEHLFCEFFRIYIIYGLSVYIFGQTCIWIHNNRRGAAGCQLFHKRFHLCWTKSAVKADSIYAKPSSNATAAGISPPVSSFAFSSKVMVTNTGNFVFSFTASTAAFLLHVYHSWFQSELHRLLLARPP